ncbi:MAG TPA: bifunctional diaminohydroxyphosphoribosylaminopyrimidine deaminase/5-amino-6-(5-phosphoribosylamino)uracil reductase RibD, partial [Blastocatellia bacterium]|nr:bifunctional diaminohydroxyphosphoribosylaminopyrimidine deaminase/5-amino-6-(5-phosphoribosylamino)uracil reductase RibD [Blastocatellia bacterium]
LVSPNPMVGAVVVNDERIAGEGYHRYDRLRHAESFALEEAGNLARGSTLYCTLEPCSHFGRTPPCTGAVIEAGITRVVVAVLDPDPRVNGAGVRILREHGLRVEIGLCGDTATALNEIYFKNAARHEPFLHLVLSGALLADRRSAVVGSNLPADWSPSNDFLDAIVDYDALVLREAGPWLAAITWRCVKRVRHRPLALIGTREALEATGDTAKLDVGATSVDATELSDVDRLIDHLRAIQATSALVLGASPGGHRADSCRADKLTIIETDEASHQTTKLERATVARSARVAEITGYLPGAVTD